MLSLDDLRRIPGLTLRDAAGNDTVEFDVATSAVEGDEVRPVVLEVRAPLHRGEPVLGGREVRIERRGGGPVPRHWTPASLEGCLNRLAELERTRRGPAERLREAEEARRRAQERRQAVIASLGEAARIFTQEGCDSFLSTLPEFLRLCGEAFLAAAPPGPEPAP